MLWAKYVTGLATQYSVVVACFLSAHVLSCSVSLVVLSVLTPASVSCPSYGQPSLSALETLHYSAPLGSHSGPATLATNCPCPSLSSWFSASSPAPHLPHPYLAINILYIIPVSSSVSAPWFICSVAPPLVTQICCEKDKVKRTKEVKHLRLISFVWI